MKLPLLATLLLLATTGWAEFRAGSARWISRQGLAVQLVGSFSEQLADKAHDPLSLVRLCVMTAKRGWPL